MTLISMKTILVKDVYPFELRAYLLAFLLVVAEGIVSWKS